MERRGLLGLSDALYGVLMESELAAKQLQRADFIADAAALESIGDQANVHLLAVQGIMARHGIIAPIQI